jgi:hypothetical protein
VVEVFADVVGEVDADSKLDKPGETDSGESLKGVKGDDWLG